MTARKARKIRLIWSNFQEIQFFKVETLSGMYLCFKKNHPIYEPT